MYARRLRKCYIGASFRLFPACSSITLNRLGFFHSTPVRALSTLEAEPPLSEFRLENNNSQAGDSSTVNELFATLNRQRINERIFISALEDLFNLNVQRKEIPNLVIESIGRHIVHLDSRGLMDRVTSNIVSCLGHLRILFPEYDSNIQNILLNGCEQELAFKPKSVFRILNGLNNMRCVIDSSVLLAIDNALGLALHSTVPAMNVIRSMGYLNIAWSSLSVETRKILQQSLVQSLATATSMELQNVLFALQLMKTNCKDLSILNPAVLSCLQTHITINDPVLLEKYINLISQLRYSYHMCSPTLQSHIEDVFITQHKRGDVYSYHYLVLMNAKFSDVSEKLQTYLIKEIPKQLKKLSKEEFRNTMKSVGDLQIPFKRFTKEEQDMICDLVLQHATPGAQSHKFYVIHGLLSMKPNFNSLSEPIQGLIVKNVDILFTNATEDAFCTAVESVGQVIKFGRFPTRAKDALVSEVFNRLPKFDCRDLCVLLNALAALELDLDRCNPDLKTRIIESISDHREKIAELETDQYNTLMNSLKYLLQD